MNHSRSGARRILLVFLIGLATAPVAASNRMKVVEGALRDRNAGFDLWGIELNNLQRLRTDAKTFRDVFQPWVNHGINTIGFALQPWGNASPFFSPDGRSASPQAMQRFRMLTDLFYSYRFCTIVGLFSVDQSQWLASPEAYRNAARLAAAALPEGHSVIFVVGDLFGSGPWAPEAPFALGDPANAIALCRVIRQANPEAGIAIPAAIVGGSGHKPNRAPLFCVAPSADALATLVDHAAEGIMTAARRAGVAVVTADRFLRQANAHPNFDAALETYARRVAGARLALRAPVPVDAGRGGYLTPEEKAAGWTALFDGRTLDGWTVLLPDWAGWSVRDGVITSPGIHAPFLRTRKAYGSFVLRLEYKIGKDSNSGVFVWAPLDGRASRFGFEVQLHGRRKKVLDADTTGAIYAIRAPRENPSYEPGRWNRVEIRCRGEHVTIRFNDRVVQDFDANEIPELRKRLHRGRIGLQDHGGDVRFRRIRILERPDK